MYTCLYENVVANKRIQLTVLGINDCLHNYGDRFALALS